MALISVIRQRHSREGLPFREISRRIGVSRSTVRKYINNEELDPKYPARKSPSKLDDYERKLRSWLFRKRNATTNNVNP